LGQRGGGGARHTGGEWCGEGKTNLNIKVEGAGLKY